LKTVLNQGLLDEIAYTTDGDLKSRRSNQIPGQVGAQVNKRVTSTLLTGGDFSTVEWAVKATETVEGVIRGLYEGIVTCPSSNSNSNSSGSGSGAGATSFLQPPPTPPLSRKHLNILNVDAKVEGLIYE